MASLARFTFDLDLGQSHRAGFPSDEVVASEPPPPPSIPEDVVADLLAQAREEAYAEGVVAGERNATSIAAQTVAAAAGRLATQSAQMTSALEEAMSANHMEAVGVAASIGRKLAQHLVAREPATELATLIAECMPSISGVPHLVVRCHPDLADQIREIATAQMATSGFSGRLVVMGEPDIRLGDGRIEWVDGGLVRDSDALASAIDQQIETYLAARTAPQTNQEHGA